MIRSRESKIKKKILIQLASKSISVISDSLWRIKMNRFGPSPGQSFKLNGLQRDYSVSNIWHLKPKSYDK